MRASQFYQVKKENSIPLVFCTRAASKDAALFSTMHKACMDTMQFKGELGEVCLILTDKGTCEVIYVGAGDGDQEVQAIAAGVNKLPPGLYRMDAILSWRAVLAWSLAQYRFEDYKNANLFGVRKLQVSEAVYDSVLKSAESIFLTRDLINRPSNALDPEALGLSAFTVASAHGAQVEEWVGEALLSANFPAIHAVGRASCSAPRLVSFTYGNKSDPLVVLVGKGVCFDSGGLDLKSASSMRFMKKDMGGAGIVLGLANWLMQEKIPIRLQVLLPMVENAVSGNAYRPGDVLSMRNGLSVEVDNTDAEGRLILADALTYACEAKPDLVVDIATLTGAARIAVGTEISAFFTNDDELANDLMQSSQVVDDPMWRMPLYKGYAGLFDSNIADLSNSTASPYAGAITAALFLQRFVEPSVKWLHVDTMAWNVSSKPGRPEGGEAMGLLAIGHYLIEKYTHST